MVQELCKTCTQPLTWIPQYQRYYCHTCHQYPPTCPTCSRDLFWAPEYQRYYCATCTQYRDLAPTPSDAQPPSVPLQFTATEIQELHQQIAKIHQAGVTTEHDYQFQLEIFKFQDTDGTYWTLGVQSGAWYYHNGTDWIRAAQPPAGLLEPANLLY